MEFKILHFSVLCLIFGTSVLSCTFENNTDYNGHDIQPVRRLDAKDPNECCSLCTLNTICKAFTFMPPKTCYLKTSDAGRRTMHGYVSGLVEPKKCSSDWNCSLSGICQLATGKCICDPWAEGEDCSYLRLLPVDKTRLGYRHPNYSSWGGNFLKADGQYHLFMAEINCNNGSSPCGLSNWGSHSQVAHAVSQHPAGPYIRKHLALPMQHHNPTVQLAKDGSWLIYSIACCGNGHISAAKAPGPNGPWEIYDTPGVFSKTNPGPLLWPNGTLSMYYRASAHNVGPCSSESIGFAQCQSLLGNCTDIKNPLFLHTSEDPSVFIDHRGNFHMLTNALPGGCKPKKVAGGHAWSRDGWNWSEPRVGAFNTTVIFTDGSNMTCSRRERPQMMLDNQGKPSFLSTGITGCPRDLAPNRTDRKSVV